MIFNDLELPRDRNTLNAWFRSFYALDPDICRITNQHSLLLSKHYQLQECEDQLANSFCRAMMKELDIITFLEQVIREYLVIGEVFVYAQLDESKGAFNRLFIQNPDYIVVKRDPVSDTVENSHRFFMRPDENMRRIVLSDEAKDIAQCQKLSSTIVSHIKNGENIPLDSHYLFSMMNRLSPYEVRGSSFLVSLLPLLKKQERSSQDIQFIRETLFDLRVLTSGALKEVIMQRYHLILDALERWLNDKLLATVAKLCGFTRKVDFGRTTELCIPKIKFDRIALRKEINKIK